MGALKRHTRGLTALAKAATSSLAVITQSAIRHRARYQRGLATVCRASSQWYRIPGPAARAVQKTVEAVAGGGEDPAGDTAVGQVLERLLAEAPGGGVVAGEQR